MKKVLVSMMGTRAEHEAMRQKRKPRQELVQRTGPSSPWVAQTRRSFFPAVQTGNPIFVSGQISAVSVELELIVEVQS